MKKNVFVLSLLGAMVLGTCPVSAEDGTREISAAFRDIKIIVDGKQLSTPAEPFIYNGTTYLPVRAVGEAVGKEVAWDNDTKTVTLTTPPPTIEADRDTIVRQRCWSSVGLSTTRPIPTMAVSHLLEKRNGRKYCGSMKNMKMAQHRTACITMGFPMFPSRLTGRHCRWHRHCRRGNSHRRIFCKKAGRMWKIRKFGAIHTEMAEVSALYIKISPLSNSTHCTGFGIFILGFQKCSSITQ